MTPKFDQSAISRSVRPAASRKSTTPNSMPPLNQNDAISQSSDFDKVWGQSVMTYQDVMSNRRTNFDPNSASPKKSSLKEHKFFLKKRTKTEFMIPHKDAFERRSPYETASPNKSRRPFTGLKPKSGHKIPRKFRTIRQEEQHAVKRMRSFSPFYLQALKVTIEKDYGPLKKPEPTRIEPLCVSSKDSALKRISFGSSTQDIRIEPLCVSSKDSALKRISFGSSTQDTRLEPLWASSKDSALKRISFGSSTQDTRLEPLWASSKDSALKRISFGTSGQDTWMPMSPMNNCDRSPMTQLNFRPNFCMDNLNVNAEQNCLTYRKFNTMGISNIETDKGHAGCRVLQKFNTTEERTSEVSPDSDNSLVKSEKKKIKGVLKNDTGIYLKLPGSSEENSPEKWPAKSNLVPRGTYKRSVRRLFTGNSDYMRSHPGTMIDVILETSEEEDDGSPNISIRLPSQQGSFESYSKSPNLPLSSFGDLPGDSKSAEIHPEPSKSS